MIRKIRQFFRRQRGSGLVTAGLRDEMENVTVSRQPTGGSFVITFGGEMSKAIPYDATPELLRRRIQWMGDPEYMGFPVGEIIEALEEQKEV